MIDDDIDHNGLTAKQAAMLRAERGTKESRLLFLGGILDTAIAELKKRRTRSVRFALIERLEAKYIGPDDEIELGEDGLSLPPPTLTVEVRH